MIIKNMIHFLDRRSMKNELQLISKMVIHQHGITQKRVDRHEYNMD